VAQKGGLSHYRNIGKSYYVLLQPANQVDLFRQVKDCQSKTVKCYHFLLYILCMMNFNCDVNYCAWRRGALKSRDLASRDLTTRYHIARVDII